MYGQCRCGSKIWGKTRELGQMGWSDNEVVCRVLASNLKKKKRTNVY